MNIQTKATNLSIAPATNDYLMKKLESLKKFIAHEDSVLCEVELAKTSSHHKSGDMFRAEINLTLNGKNLYAFAEKDTLHSAIDEVRDEIMRELTSHKDKQKTLFRRGAARIKNMIKGLPGFRRWR